MIGFTLWLIRESCRFGGGGGDGDGDGDDDEGIVDNSHCTLYMTCAFSTGKGTTKSTSSHLQCVETQYLR